jgi:pyruvate formate lyase activating enzyme
LGTILNRWGITPEKSLKTRCKNCGESKEFIAKILGVCVECIRNIPSQSLPHLIKTHIDIRKLHNLPGTPPRSSVGLLCNLCANMCQIGVGEKGFCGIRWNEGELKSLSSRESGLLHMYLDPHVTNCCSSWFCPGGTGAGYPEFCYTRRYESGYHNLSVFFYGCSFNCLFCQNSSHKNLRQATKISTDEFADNVKRNHRISCICFFGGSPEPQLPFAISASKKARDAVGNRLLRICFEWNGCGDKNLVKEAAQLSLISGGNIKFDLKSYTPSLNVALTGVDNKRTFDNFKMIGESYYFSRPELPLLTATTLMVPGYVDSYEVENIAKFIADIDPSIPFSLLTFYPNYRMMDLPITPISQAVDCYKVASIHLENVNVGNLHLLGISSFENFKSLIA